MSKGEVAFKSDFQVAGAIEFLIINLFLSQIQLWTTSKRELGSRN